MCQCSRDHPQWRRSGLSEEACAKIHQALQTCENLFDLDLYVPGVSDVFGASHHFTKEQCVLVFDADRREGRYAAARNQAQPLVFYPAKNTGYPLQLAVSGGRNLYSCLVRMVGQHVHVELIGREEAVR